MDYISVKGAREHNLKNIDVLIPRNKLVVVTGVSGSGKSTLVFDTIYAEGQRRYVECLSAYARQFLELMPRPDVDSIEGLSPSIAIEQRSARWNPRSTVATSSEIYDYLRVLYARIGKPYCPDCGVKIEAQTVQNIVDKILSLGEGTKIFLLSPIITGKKGEHKKEIENIKKRGFSRIKIDGELFDLLEDEIELDKNKKHTIEVVVDRFVIKKDNSDLILRITSSVELATEISKGNVIVEIQNNGKQIFFSTNFSCPECSFSFPEITPRLFSFNSPYGACKQCHGLGEKIYLDEKLLIDENDTISNKAIKIFRKGIPSYFAEWFSILSKQFGRDITAEKISKLPKQIRNILLYGSESEFITRDGYTRFEGIIPYLWQKYNEDPFTFWEVERYLSTSVCPECKGARLRKEALSIKVAGIQINEIVNMPIQNAYNFFKNIELDEYDKQIASRILKEITSRLSFMVDVGIGYIELSRPSSTLSGGEAQRLKLATQVGSGLVGVLYVLDEPTCGLHPRDVSKLINTLKKLRDTGNTVIVAEHDRDTIMSSDWMIDLGPGAGIHGGTVVFQGDPHTAVNNSKNNQTNGSLTSQYLSGILRIDIPHKRRKPGGKCLFVRGARGHNLKNIDVKFPLGLFICVTGVSGSGKSSLVIDTLYNYLARRIRGYSDNVLENSFIGGAEYIKKVLNIDQSPIGRTPRSNPSTYTGIFTPIREIFASLPEVRARGWKPGRFSFNVRGGRCEECEGQGVIKVEMHFLPDVYVTCKTCNGKRFNRDTLEIRYRGKNIHDVLEMTAEEALNFFSNIPHIKNKLEVMYDVGLGYIKLGQPATTLSGGEAQRVKLVRELAKSSDGDGLYILDEPTVGLHFDDIKKLIKILQKLVDCGNTVIVIEHNLDVIKVADWIIDLGPDGGDNGGRIVAEGTPEDVIKNPNSWTGRFLREVLR